MYNTIPRNILHYKCVDIPYNYYTGVACIVELVDNRENKHDNNAIVVYNERGERL